MCVCVCSVAQSQSIKSADESVCGPRIFWSGLDDHQTGHQTITIIIIIKRSHRFSKLNQTLPNTITIGPVQYLKTFSCCTGPPFTPRGDKKHCQAEKSSSRTSTTLIHLQKETTWKKHLRKLPLAVLYNKISITVFFSLTFSPSLKLLQQQKERKRNDALLPLNNNSNTTAKQRKNSAALKKFCWTRKKRQNFLF